MGPWFIRDTARPFRPGCSYQTLIRLIDRGLVDRYSILRGPSTRQLWTVARHVPGIAHVLGYCHACDARVRRTDHSCPRCAASFSLAPEIIFERNLLGLPQVQPLPGDPDEHLAAVGREERATNGHRRSVGATHGGTISSFAPDEEILAVREMLEPLRPMPVQPVVSASVTPEAPESALERVTLDTLNRSLRATVDRQQTMIRLLMVLVAILAAIVAWHLVQGVLARREAAPQATTTAVGIDSDVPSAEAPSPTDGGAPPGRTRAGDDTSGTSIPEADVGAADTTGSAIIRAAEVLDRVERGEGELDDRRASTVAVLTELEAMRQALPESSGAQDPERQRLDELIERVRAALAKLELESFTSGI